MKSYKTTNYEFYSLNTVIIDDKVHEVTFRFENIPNDSEEENLYVYMSKKKACELFGKLKEVFKND